jgi:hypothetical protein
MTPPPSAGIAKWDKTVRTFLEIEGVEPTNNAAERALRPAVIQRKISHGVQSSSSKGALCRSCLLTVTTSLRQQGRDVRAFLEQAWIADRLRSGVAPRSAGGRAIRDVRRGGASRPVNGYDKTCRPC